jgi:hypothetical protein
MISRVNELIHFTKLDLPRPLTIGHEDQNDWFRTCVRGRVRPSAWLISARDVACGFGLLKYRRCSAGRPLKRTDASAELMNLHIQH